MAKAKLTGKQEEALTSSMYHPDTSLLESLLASGISPDVTPKAAYGGAGLIHDAIDHWRSDLVELLIRSGADLSLSRVDPWRGWTPLEKAYVFMQSTERSEEGIERPKAAAQIVEMLCKALKTTPPHHFVLGNRRRKTALASAIKRLGLTEDTTIVEIDGAILVFREAERKFIPTRMRYRLGDFVSREDMAVVARELGWAGSPKSGDDPEPG